MKKNILAIVILAATLVNLTLVAIMLFTLNPYVKRANELITRICQVIDLELESPNANGDNDVISAADRDNFTIYSTKDSNYLPLYTSDDGKTYIIGVDATLTLNKKHEDYEKIKPLIESNLTIIQSLYSKEISKYTREQIANEDLQNDIKKNILEAVRKELFENSKCVYDVTITFGIPMVQK